MGLADSWGLMLQARSFSGFSYLLVESFLFQCYFLCVAFFWGRGAGSEDLLEFWLGLGFNLFCGACLLGVSRFGLFLG